MRRIDDVIWYERGEVRSLKPEDEGRAFKWILAEKEGRLILMAMAADAGLDFHNELRDAVCKLADWNVNELTVLGGGVRLRSGEILHSSTHFGEMPEKYREAALNLLGLKKASRH